jgi:hypothetical protein
MTELNLVRLRELAAELGYWPATTDEADIERHRQHNKNADYWLARGHRFDHLRRDLPPALGPYYTRAFKRRVLVRLVCDFVDDHVGRPLRPRLRGPLHEAFVPPVL